MKPISLRRSASGQAIIEYILMVVMLAVTMAVVIRNSNRTVYQYWTGLVRQVARGCADCTTKTGPNF